MGNPNLSQLATAPPSLTSILKKISENKAYVLFKNLATSNNNGRFIPPLKEMNLSTKQYYPDSLVCWRLASLKDIRVLIPLLYLVRLFMTHR
jgi:hypothetical protein